MTQAIQEEKALRSNERDIPVLENEFATEFIEGTKQTLAVSNPPNLTRGE